MKLAIGGGNIPLILGHGKSVLSWIKRSIAGYWSLNLTLDRSFHGESVNQGVVFSSNFKFSYDLTPKVAGGLEYYGSGRSGDGLRCRLATAAPDCSRD